MKILLVDDERLLVKGLRRSLETEGCKVTVAYDGASALAELDTNVVDLVILDIMLPVIDGLEVCRRIRRFSNVPIIMLTAKGDDVDKVVGLELGADDYLSKPFNTRELLARIKAVTRRTAGCNSTSNIAQDRSISAGPHPRLLRYGALNIDLDLQRVQVGERAVDLTVREFELLSALAGHPGRVYTRDVLLNMVWGSNYYTEPRVVDVYIRRLRQKIEADPAKPRWILTRWGAGYYFQE